VTQQDIHASEEIKTLRFMGWLFALGSVGALIAAWRLIDDTSARSHAAYYGIAGASLGSAMMLMLVRRSVALKRAEFASGLRTQISPWLSSIKYLTPAAGLILLQILSDVGLALFFAFSFGALATGSIGYAVVCRMVARFSSDRPH
jgi:hypothetical protein